ncbi:preprotein translocase subunit SecY [Sulfoacidibacillus thermotolerans]|uniref:Protein translocase subunit SecY n=1 Tax=Sulfoacidibacillus thermotolerans TaxID=1765684 RepID=A0A2U3DBI0_SULT2|nr:preprotein translocase subunit SecY [Sulfoacidibacillus thermotolerans]PWI58636.1 preprotein translocase subunit SecY [Sulfoacidibacillus thermotolerans]
MWQSLGRVWRAKDLRRRLLITLLILAIYRIGAVIPVPGVNASMLQSLAAKSPVVGLLNTFSGGALFNFSIFSMSIYPYVTASIIVQLLQMGVITQWEDWSKEGETGRAKLTQWTRYLTILLGLVQSSALTFSFSRQLGPGFIVDPSIWTYILIALTLTAGTTFLMWLGEQITDKGVGNGISVIIFLSILSRLETVIPQIYTNWFYAHPDQLFLNIIKVIVMMLGVLILVVFVVFVQQGVRRIPVQYTQKQVGQKVYSGQSTFIPIKVNAAGVIPVIFATSVLFFPTIIAQFFRGNHVADWIISTLSPTSTVFIVAEMVLIVGFTFFYTLIQINPSQLAEQMQKNGGYILGVRPGKATEDYLIRIMNRLSLVGGIFLAVVSAVPYLFMGVTGLSGVAFYFGGTSLLIVIGVALDTVRQLEGLVLQRSYKGFIR